MTSGDISLAIGNFPVLQAGIYQQGLYQESYVLLASRERAAAGCVTVEDFRESRHVIVTAGNSGHYHSEIEKRLAALVPERRSARDVRSAWLHGMGSDQPGLHPRQSQRHHALHPDGILLVHAGGGAGLFSAMIGGWANGTTGSQPVTHRVTTARSLV